MDKSRKTQSCECQCLDSAQYTYTLKAKKAYPILRMYVETAGLAQEFLDDLDAEFPET